MNTLDIKDLCVGSYVGSGDQIFQVIGIHNADMVRIKLNDPSGLLVWVRDYHPIPINADWLDRLDIEKGLLDVTVMPDQSVSREFYCGELRIIYNNKRNYCDVLTSQQHFMEVYSVHQLQQVVWMLERTWLTLAP